LGEEIPLSAPLKNTESYEGVILDWGSDNAAGLFGSRSEVDFRTEDYFHGLFKSLEEWRSELDGSFQVRCSERHTEQRFLDRESGAYQVSNVEYAGRSIQI